MRRLFALLSAAFVTVLAPGGDGASGKAVVEAKGVKVPAGANITVVAHLDASGDPALTPYVNDVSRIPAGQARLIVRHDAAAPTVDVRANGQSLRRVQTGDRVVVQTVDGSRTFRVVKVQLISKRTLDLNAVFDREGRPLLRILTCGGPYLPDQGGYQDNVVVTAALA
jgi:hypothetical protein